jgi:hypothetical protein
MQASLGTRLLGYRFEILFRSGLPPLHVRDHARRDLAAGQIRRPRLRVALSGGVMSSGC